MTRFSLVTALFFSFSGLNAQDLHIYYDVFRDSIWYMSNGKHLDRPIVRHGSQVNFHLVEYNRYALQTGIQTLQEDITPGMTTGGLLLPDPLGAKAAGTIGGPPSNAGKLTVLSSFEEYPSMPAIPAIGNARGPLSEVVQTLEDLHGLDRSIRSGFLEVEALEHVFLQMEDMGEALDAMLGNPFLPPSLVQEEAARYREVLDENLAKLDFRQSASRHRSLLRSLKDQRDSLSQLMETVEEQQVIWQDSDQEPVQALVQTMGQAIGVSGQYKKLLEESIELAEEFDEQLQQKSPSEWENLRLRLKEVDMTPFSLHSQQLAERDQLTYEVAIQLQGEVAERLGMEAGQAFRNRIIKVSAYGGFKVNASVGMGFGSFLKPVEAYFIHDGLIGSRPANQFFPSLVSFLHFYTQGKRNLSLGGSFGVGLPLMTAAEGQSAAFFLGPSLFIGKRERLVFSVGLTGAQAKRLDEGYQPGDRYDGFQGEIPVFSHYELGVFVGLSFNVFGQE